MNYLTEIKLFYDWLETHPMTPSAIALWHGLISLPIGRAGRMSLPSRCRSWSPGPGSRPPPYTGFGSSSRKQSSLRCSRLVEEPAQPIGSYHLSHVLLSKMGNKMKDKWKTKVKSDGNRASLLSKMENKEVSMSFPAQRVIKVLEKVIWLNGKPRNNTILAV